MTDAAANAIILAVFMIGPVLFCIGLIRAALSPRRRK
jgi:hypothetical protein